MNQSILFPDLQDWDTQTQSVVFPVQVQGANIECRISLNKLVSLAAAPMAGDDGDKAAKALALFEEYRFDIEEEVEELIEQETFDELGRVVLL
ncbi:DUF1488 domain-containing protein [Shewanella schlegeliana]|uniref:DUF1488 domain-containing protein n=1 Tax=Shewanella schlegeliana TaxID=190308 RepID=A0ABS1T3E7_9GAMM|nr:DUF1488 domain-containing protein [Shewanella schlegeliana]MBL4915314.1 DUF1488 domain-containing protein [Shewanella schlegeliana]MCL1111522.1 DUF1488 domain-containing protein [Shewanella schlegeliana]GIU34912.1 hypothetical protein TUM4433_31570 [Shewanella schlegeliana]